MRELDFISLAPQIGKYFLGEPSKVSSKEIRWGTHGSWCLNTEEGLFYSFEQNDGGGVIWLIEYFGSNIDDVINQFAPTQEPVQQKEKSYTSFTQDQMRSLASEAEIICKYSNTFVVMRFPEGHRIKAKYAPFTFKDGQWYNKRPEGKMPIYLSKGDISEPIIINEGEKAVKGSEALYDGTSCCWHGGTNGWANCDWTPVFNKEIVIWPDNDEAGAKAAKELSEHLAENGAKVKIAVIPKHFNAKDDLFDANTRQDFTKQTFLEYVNKYTRDTKKSSLTLIRVRDLVENIKKPEWVIENVCERDSVMDIYGAPKSGKSFVAVDMALNITLGREWHGHATTKSPVVYLAGEGLRGIARRVKAWEHYYEQDTKNADLFISDRGVRFLDKTDHELLIEHIYAIQDEIGDIGMIFVDTLARNFGAGNENSTEDMNLFIERVDDLKNTFHTCVALVHHTGHNSSGRARGSSVLPAAVDAEYAVKRKDDNEDDMCLEFTQTLVKDGKNIKPIYFKFQEVALPGQDDMTSGVLVEIDRTDIVIDDSNALKEVEEKIAEIQESIANGTDSDPVTVWVKHSDIVRAMPHIKENAIKGRLKRLREEKKVHWEAKTGYQSKKYDEII